MGSDALSKLTKAGETAWKSFQQKWYEAARARSKHTKITCERAN